ncbi:hypothetical protein PoB_007234700 [Plakobranchus ocellatus]|uniref:Uncharacterized protein n=1 Tax=Plakobranchus ocellatus TaxID=259542 RepID=A0AAV4DNB1_9GAST|nr:hypothetical protein PoB_007234700 [Plakobranchus ocellatus]
MAILDRNNSSAPDGSSNTTNSSGPRSANTANTAVARNTRPSVARDADENPSHGRDSPGSGETFWLTGALFYLLLLIRDIMTFLIRGGLGAMMFAMDQVLRAVLLVVQGVFGSTDPVPVCDSVESADGVWAFLHPEHESDSVSLPASFHQSVQMALSSAGWIRPPCGSRGSLMDKINVDGWKA